MTAKSAAGLLTSVDSIFTTQEERDNAQRSYVTDLSAAEISDFPNHPFKVRMDEEMVRLVVSVKERGVLSPVLVRPLPDGSYQMVAGHRRKRAAELAELPTVPCIVRELTDDEATIIMVDSNLQREQVLPSEKAFAYQMKLDAMNRQAGRPPKNNLTPVVSEKNPRTNEQLAAQVGESREQIRRYIRLTNLIPEILDMVDNSVVKEKDKLQMALRSVGCQFYFASIPPCKGEITCFIVWQITQCKKLGVEIKYTTEADVEMIKAATPDAVILATGGVPKMIPILGLKEYGIPAIDVLGGKMLVVKKYVVVGGGQVGAETPHFLAQMLRDMSIVGLREGIALDAYISINWELNEHLDNHGVKKYTGANIRKVTENSVVSEKDGREMVLSTDSIIVAILTTP